MKQRFILFLSITIISLGSCSETFENPVDPGFEEVFPERPFDVRTQVLADSLIRLTWSARQNYGFEIDRDGSTIALVLPGDSSLSQETKSYVVEDRTFTVTDNPIEYVIFSKLPNGNKSGDSLQVSITLGAPSNFQIVSQNRDGVHLEWTDNSSFETGFLLEFKTSEQSDFSQITTVDPNVTEYVHEFDIEIPKVYDYRLTAISNKVESSSLGLQVDYFPLEIFDIEVSQEDSSRVTLNWRNGLGQSFGTEISMIDPISLDTILIETIDPSLQEYVHNNPPFSEYERFQYILSSVGTSASYDTDDDLPEARFPFAPRNLSLTTTGFLGVTLEWEAVSNIHSGVYIYRKIGNREKELVQRLTVQSTRWTDPGPFPADSMLTFYVRNYDQITQLESGEISGSTSIVFTPPSNLTVESLFATEITLSWTDENEFNNGTKIYRSVNNGPFEIFRSITSQANPVRIEDVLDAQRWDTVMFAVSFTAEGIESSLSDTVRVRTELIGFDTSPTDFPETRTLTAPWKLSPDKEHIAGAFFEGFVWNNNQNLTQAHAFELPAAANPVSSERVAAVSWEQDKLGVFWSTEGLLVTSQSNFSQIINFIPQGGQGFDFKPGASTVGILYDSSTLVEHSVSTGAELQRFGLRSQQFEYVQDNSGDVISVFGTNVNRYSLSAGLSSFVFNYGNPTSRSQTDNFVVSHDGKFVLIPTDYRTFALYNVANGAEIWSVRTNLATNAHSKVALSPNNELLVVAYHTNAVGTGRVKLLNPSENYEYADIAFAGASNSVLYAPTFIDEKRVVIPGNASNKVYELLYVYREF